MHAMRPSMLAYRGLQRLARSLTPVMGRGRGKVAKALAGRLGADARLVAWARRSRVADRPGLWFHAPSVGEGLQARAVLEATAARVPALQAAFTHFSPSAERLAAAMPVDIHDYLPWDLPGPMATVLDALAPDAVVFTKTEVWPVLVEAAATREVPVALVAATLPPGARRRGALARRFLRPTWRRLSLVAAAAEEDAAGLVDLGVPPDAVHVTGDPGIDSAARRAGEADPASPWLAPFRADPRPTVVAGSTWPADEEVLKSVLGALRSHVPGLRVILAPHEPTDERVAGLSRGLASEGWRVGSLADVEEAGAEGVDAVVVERLGVLAHLYTVGTAAYVGGGFHRHGLHSVLEPAAAGVPVTFGPRHANARSASDLIEGGGAREAADAGALARILMEWLGDSSRRDYVGLRASDYIDRHRGAADRTARLVAEFCARGEAPPRPAGPRPTVRR